MKRKILLATLGAILAAAGTVQADVYARLQGLFALPTGASYSGGAGLGLAAGWNLDSRFALELGFRNWAVASEGSIEGLSLGRLCVLPVEVAFQARFPLGSRLHLFGQFGLGYAFHSFKLDENYLEDWNELGFEIEENAENGISARLGAGLELTLTPKMSLDFTAGYNLLGSKGVWSITDTASGETASGDPADLSFDALTFSLGLKIALFSPEGGR